MELAIVRLIQIMVGVFLFKDIIEGNEIDVEVESNDGKKILF